MAVEIGYVALSVKDIARAKEFYGKLFGWDIAVTPMGGHVGNTKLPIGLTTGAAAHVPFIYFKVPDMEAATKRITELGGRISNRSTSQAGLIAECVDNQETIFSIWQPAPGFE